MKKEKPIEEIEAEVEAEFRKDWDRMLKELAKVKLEPIKGRPTRY